MKKAKFAPSPDQLEGRIVLSGGPQFSNGSAILTQKALGQTYTLVQKAFNQYATHGQNANRLRADLASAVNRIPYNQRDGLLAAMQSEVSQLVSDIRGNVPSPVKSLAQLSDVNDFVQGGIAGGTMVMASSLRPNSSPIAVAGGPKFLSGAAVLTRKALGQTTSLIQKAFVQYMNHGQNANRLRTDLAKAVSRVPYNRRDGLLADVLSEVPAMVTDIRGNTPLPVKKRGPAP